MNPGPVVVLVRRRCSSWTTSRGARRRRGTRTRARRRAGLRFSSRLRFRSEGRKKCLPPRSGRSRSRDSEPVRGLRPATVSPGRFRFRPGSRSSPRTFGGRHRDIRAPAFPFLPVRFSSPSRASPRPSRRAFFRASRFEPAGRSSACSARTSGAAAEPAGLRRTRRPSRARSRFQRARVRNVPGGADVPDPDATVSSAVLRCELPGVALLELPGVASASEASISVERRRSLSPGGAGLGSVAGGVQILALVASPRLASVIPGTLARDGGDETRAEGSGFSSGGTSSEDALDEEKERSESGGGGSSSSHHRGEGASCWFGSVGPVAARVGPSGGSATCASPALGGRRRATLRVLNGGLGSGAWDDSTPPFVLRVANACAERSEPIGTSVERGRGGGGHQRVTLAGWGFEDPRERSRDAFASDAATRNAASVASRATAPRLPLPWVFSCAFAGARTRARDRRARAGAIACAFGAGAFPRRGSGGGAAAEGPRGVWFLRRRFFVARRAAAPATVAVRRAPSAFSAYPSKSPSDGGGVLWISGEDFDADAVRHACAFAGAGAATVSFSGSGSSSGSSSSASGASSPFAASEATAMSSALVACEIPAAAGEGLPGAAPVAIFARGAFGEEGGGDLAPAAWLEYLPGGGRRAVEPRRGVFFFRVRGVRGDRGAFAGPAGGAPPCAFRRARATPGGSRSRPGTGAGVSLRGGGGGGEGRRRRRRARVRHARARPRAGARRGGGDAGLEDALVPGERGERELLQVRQVLRGVSFRGERTEVLSEKVEGEGRRSKVKGRRWSQVCLRSRQVIIIVGVISF